MAPVRLARPAALVLLLLPAPAWAFDWFGLRSGMTQDQVRAAAPAGSSLRLNGDFGFIEKGGEAVATVTFCRGRLIALSRTIDAQSDWFALADRMIKQYGAPKGTPPPHPGAGAQGDGHKGPRAERAARPQQFCPHRLPARQARPRQGAGQPV